MPCAPCVYNFNHLPREECARIHGWRLVKHFVGYPALTRDDSLGLFSHPSAKYRAVGSTHAEHQRWWEGNQPHATRAAPATALSVHGGRRPFVRSRPLHVRPSYEWKFLANFLLLFRSAQSTRRVMSMCVGIAGGVRCGLCD